MSKSHHGSGHTCGSCDPAPYVHMNTLNEATFYAFAHVICGKCGWGMKADIIKHGRDITLGIPTKCANPKCMKYRGDIKDGKKWNER